MANQVQLYL